MNRVWPVAALLSAVLLLVAGCTLGTNTKTGSNQPVTSPAAQASVGIPQSSPTSAGGTPASTPASTPSSQSTPSNAVLAITNLPFHNGEVGIGYTPIALGAGGGTPPYSWSISGGALPAGLSLSGGGQVSGTPSAAGHPSFSVQVTDSVGGTATGPGSVNIFATLAVTQPCAGLCSVEQGCAVCGNFGGINGGASPFTYSVTAGAPPDGMGRSGLSLTGAFPPPGPLGAFNMTVRVRDLYGAQQDVNANWYVFPHIVFSVGSAQCGPSYGCRIQIPYTMGTPNGTPTVSFSKITCGNQTCTGLAPEPPANTLLSWKGFNYSVGGGNVTIVFLSPGTYGDWVGSFNLTITDQSVCGPGAAKCSSTITVVVDSERRFG